MKVISIRQIYLNLPRNSYRMATVQASCAFGNKPPRGESMLCPNGTSSENLHAPHPPRDRHDSVRRTSQPGFATPCCARGRHEIDPHMGEVRWKRGWIRRRGAGLPGGAAFGLHAADRLPGADSYRYRHRPHDLHRRRNIRGILRRRQADHRQRIPPGLRHCKFQQHRIGELGSRIRREFAGRHENGGLRECGQGCRLRLECPRRRGIL